MYTHVQYKIHLLNVTKEKHLGLFATNELCRLVWSLVDERLKGFLHQVDKALIPLEAHFHHVVYFVLKVQQVLNHVFIFLGIDDNGCPEGLQTQNITKSATGLGFQRVSFAVSQHDGSTLSTGASLWTGGPDVHPGR